MHQTRPVTRATRHGRALAVLALTLLTLPRITRAQAAATPPDWKALGAEAADLLSQYLRINTTNPPGNELAAARFLRDVLQRNGIEARILDTAELGPGRANLYARLRGTGRKGAIALVHHMDVVPATASFWHVPPFSGEIRDGYVWGRGALDMKGQGIVHLVTLLALERSHVPLDRDIVFIANADEELGSTGVMTFVQRHPDLLRGVEYLVTEGGDNRVVGGKLQYFGVGVAEKRTFWQRLTVNGIPSHASRPTPANPVPRLIAALDRIAHAGTPLHVTPGVRKYFHDIAPGYPEPQRGWLADVDRAITDSAARAWLVSDVYRNAILRNTVTPTVLAGSNKTNVIPPQASAELDVRLLPDASADSVLAWLRAAAADTAVHFTTLLQPKQAIESPTDNAFFRAIERAARERDPRAVVTTPMLTGATDRPVYRAAGIATYGLDPFEVESSDVQRGVHGNDERVSLANLTFGVHFLYDILRYAQ